MALLFTIIDQFGTPTVIDEPIGWDAINLHYIRHKDWHGFIDTVDDSMGSLQFYGSGRDILRNAFISLGMQAQCGFLVEYQCDDKDSWDTIYTGQFCFYKYKEVQGLNGCHVECSIESNNNVMTLKNRYEQKVDLDSLIPFQTPASPAAASAPQVLAMSIIITIPPDPAYVTVNTGDTYLIPAGMHSWGGSSGQLAVRTDSGWTYTTPADDTLLIDLSTDLAYQYHSGVWSPYTGQMASYSPALGGNIMLPPKPIVLHTDADVDTASSVYHFNSEDNGGASSHCFTIGFNVGSQQDVKDFGGIADSWDDVNLTSTGNNTNVGDKAGPLLSYNPDANYIGTEISLNINIDFTLEAETRAFDTDHNPVYTPSTNNVQVSFMRAVLCKSRSMYQDGMQHHYYPPTSTDHTIHFQDTLLNFNGPCSTVPSFTYTSPNITVTPGDNIYLVFQLEFNGQGSHYYCKVTANGSCHMSMVTGFEETPAPVYMINESLSRVTEAVTNDQIRVYSDFFGRTDSLPYDTKISPVSSHTPGIGQNKDGEGSLLSITNGLLIRDQVLKDGSRPPMVVSLKELFEALNAIYNLGMSVEPDITPGREGKHWLRIEPMQHFYSGTQILTCDNVDEIVTEVAAEKYVGLFKTGYSKWQGEQTGGLDDFMTRREYRTGLSTIKNVLEKMCGFLGSSYAIETTRRQSGVNSDDWRFDHEIFLLCIERDPTPLSANGSGYGAITVAMTGGSVDTITIGSGGSGYYVPPIVTLSAPPAGGILARAQATVSTSGVITAINVTNPGSGYTSAPSVTITPAVLLAMQVEQNSINSAGYANIVSPNSLYNYRISPLRNALRWVRSIFQSYADWRNGRLYYVSGEANIIAKGEYNGIGSTVPVIENSAMAENTAEISYADFANPGNYYPLFSNETVKFTYPLSYTDWNHIQSDPYGLVKYRVNDGDWHYGWIEDLKYSPFLGTAEFTLRPQI